MQIEKLYPVCKDYLWGGEKLKENYGKITDKTPCAESWELSYHQDGKTLLSSGKTLSETASLQDLGKNALGFPFFPVLVKFIDAKQPLSVQVHPSDEYALAHENSFGKTEMWYIVEAEEGAGIYLGFEKDITKEECIRAIQEKKLTEYLQFFKVKAGECYFIPSGTVHAIGAGCLICEIQQNSNLTYRVYDYGRKDKNGNERELHVDKALKVSNLQKFYPQKTLASDKAILGKCPYFAAESVFVRGEKIYQGRKNTFACMTCVRGNGALNGEKISQGDSFFIPAGEREISLNGDMDLIVTYVPDKE